MSKQRIYEFREGNHAWLGALHELGNIPQNFVPVLKWLIENGAYKPHTRSGETSGHFGCVVDGKPFQRISSARRVDHSKVFEEGVVKIYDTDDVVMAEGAEPSVGEHTQLQIYEEINSQFTPSEMQVHSIIHFHSPLRRMEKVMLGGKPSVLTDIPMRLQDTASGMAPMVGLNITPGVPGLWAVHLKGHGPNIAFHRDLDPQVVIDFIDKHWDLSQKSGGNPSE